MLLLVNSMAAQKANEETFHLRWHQQQRKRKCTFNVLLTYLPKRNETNAKILDLRTASRSGLVSQPSWLNKPSGDLFFLPKAFGKKIIRTNTAVSFISCPNTRISLRMNVKCRFKFKKKLTESLSNNLKRRHSTQRNEFRGLTTSLPYWKQTILWVDRQAFRETKHTVVNMCTVFRLYGRESTVWLSFWAWVVFKFHGFIT